MKQFLKNLTFKNILIYVSNVLTPIYAAIFWLGILIAFDLITGIIKARKAGDKITSNKLKDTAIKTLIYFMLIIAAHIMDSQFVSLDFLPAKAAQLTAGFLAVIEIKSIFENAHGILGVSLLDYFKQKMAR